MNLQFLIIDPQNDFANPSGSLYVPHANRDSERLARLIKRLKLKISEIHVTLDTHHWVDIAHPIFWLDPQGKHPAPFTTITHEDVLNGKWQTTRPDYQTRAIEYVKTLKTKGRYELTIWPPHCLIGKPGHNVVNSIASALMEWENTFAMVDYVFKGSNIWTEHYSAVQAEVPDSADSSTLLNTRLLEHLRQADVIVISGQALSHCVANTVRDIADNFSREDIRKMLLIEDTTSSVPGFEALGQQFLMDMKVRGMQTVRTVDFPSY